eukprot:m.289686 g.289686  ORF g.289686 m.289686 type:complete len:429 (+) comp12170_c0_seq1:145-1431(+)
MMFEMDEADSASDSMLSPTDPFDFSPTAELPTELGLEGGNDFLGGSFLGQTSLGMGQQSSMAFQPQPPELSAFGLQSGALDQPLHHPQLAASQPMSIGPPTSMGHGLNLMTSAYQHQQHSSQLFGAPLSQSLPAFSSAMLSSTSSAPFGQLPLSSQASLGASMSSAPPPSAFSLGSAPIPISAGGSHDESHDGGGFAFFAPPDYSLESLERMMFSGDNLSAPAQYHMGSESFQPVSSAPEPATHGRERTGSFSMGRRSSTSGLRFNPMEGSRTRAHSFHGNDSDSPHMLSQSVPDSVISPAVPPSPLSHSSAATASRPRAQTLDSSSFKGKRKGPTPSDSKTCSCCGCSSTPMWRDGRDGNRLCNACGIRWQKYGVSCINCMYVPRKLESAQNQKCKRCGFELPPPEMTRRQLAASRQPRKTSSSADD